MNKKYMDFVPAKPAPAKKLAADKKQPVSAVQKKEVDELELSKMFEAKHERPRAGVTTTGKVSGTFEVPKARFVNTEKVAKRPLSKNVYPRKAVVPEEPEKPSKPVTIINKPEKDSKIGMVVAIIITIILGAAAGTVAFLLLPN